MRRENRLTKLEGLLFTFVILTLLLAACVQEPASTMNAVQTQSGIVKDTQAAVPNETPSPAPSQATSNSTTLPTVTAVESPSPAATQALETAAPTGVTGGPTGVPAGGEVIRPENALQVQAITGIQLPETRLFAWLPDSQNVAVATETEIVFYSLNPLQATGRFPAPQATQLEISPDGSFLAWAGEDNVLHIWSIPDNKELQTLTGRTGGLSSVKFSPDSKLLAVSSPEGTVELWDPTNAQKQQSWKLAYWVTGLNFSPDGSLLAGVELDNFTVHLFQVPSGQEERSLSWTEHASPALYGADFTPDWKTLAWWSRGTVQLMDVKTGNPGPSLGHEDFISALAISPSGSLLASAAAGTFGESFQPLVYLWETNNGDMITQLPLEAAVNALKFSPDGRTLAILTSDNILRFFEIP